MRKWYAVLANNPHDCIVVEMGALDEAALKRFDEGASSNKVRAIGLIGMWIIDHATEREVAAGQTLRENDEVRLQLP